MYIEPEFRDYQESDYENIIKAFTENKSVVYQAPTGSGKSVVISKHILDKIKSGRKIVFMSNRTHLQNQMYTRLLSCGVSDIGLFNSSNINAINCQVILVTIQTAIAANNMDLLLATHIDDIVIDECHRSVTKSYLDIIGGLTKRNNDINLFGVTATTNRFDMMPLDIIYNTMVSCSKTMKCLVEEGYLAKHRIFTIPLTDLEDEIESYGGDFAMESMSKYMRNPLIVKKCVEQYRTYADGRSTIVYCVDKKHTVQLQKAYSDAGYSKSVIIDDSVSEKDREAMFDKFKTGEINLIFCIETLTEGLDLPNCNCIQLCRPTKSMILYLQMVGRGLRPKEDGGDCIILDSALNVDRLGMPTSDISWDLGGKRHKRSQKKGKVIVYKGDDGKTYFDQNEDIPFAEMVEVGFGELAEASEQLIAYAESHNNRLYVEFYAQFKDLCLYIIKGAGVDTKDIVYQEPKEEDIIQYNGIEEVRFMLKDREFGFSMEISRQNKSIIKISKERTYGLNPDKEMKDYFIVNKLNKIVGDIGYFINNNIKNIMDNLVSISIEPEQLQDINELKTMQREAKEAHFVNAVEHELAKNGRAFFKIKKAFDLHDYATSLDYRRVNYLAIVNQKTLLTNNKVVFFNRYDNILQYRHYTKSFKQDRFRNILRSYDGELVTDISDIENIENYEMYL